MGTVIHVVDAAGYRTETDLAIAEQLLGADGTSIWIDADERNPRLEAFLTEKLHLHALAQEDVFAECSTPKVEDYGDFVYIVMHGVLRNAEDPENMGTHEIDLLFGKNWVFTHHAAESRSINSVRDELTRNPRALSRGPAYLVHSIIDHLTDYYTPLVEKFDDEVDDIEKDVVENPKPELLQKLFALKRSLQKLRRTSVYHRDVLQRLSRGEFDLIPAHVRPFFRDVYDQFVRFSDLADSYRELVASALEIYMSVTANRTNEIMKSLAMISTLMLPLTFFTGVWGMNFEHMPLIHARSGFPVAIAIMIVIAALFYLRFRLRKWW